MEMLNKTIANKIIVWLTDNQQISEELREEILYALLVLLTETEKLLMISLVLTLFHLGKECLVIIVVLSITKHFWGGYHVHSYWGCFLVSMAVFAGICWLALNCVLSEQQVSAIYTLGFIVVLLVAPVESDNHIEMYCGQRIVIKCISLIVLGLLVVVDQMFLTKGGIIQWTVFASEIDLICGYVYRKRGKHEGNINSITAYDE